MVEITTIENVKGIEKSNTDRPQPEDVDNVLYIGIQEGREVFKDIIEDEICTTIHTYFNRPTNLIDVSWNSNMECRGVVQIGDYEGLFEGLPQSQSETRILEKKSGLVPDENVCGHDWCECGRSTSWHDCSNEDNDSNGDDNTMTFVDEMEQLADDLEEQELKEQREREKQRVKEYLRKNRDVFKAEIVEVGIRSSSNDMLGIVLDVPTYGKWSNEYDLPNGDGRGERLYEILDYLGATLRDMDMVEGMYLPVQYNADEWEIHLPSDKQSWGEWLLFKRAKRPSIPLPSRDFCIVFLFFCGLIIFIAGIMFVNPLLLMVGVITLAIVLVFD